MVKTPIDLVPTVLAAGGLLLVVTYCLGMMTEHPKSKSTEGFYQQYGSPCTSLSVVFLSAKRISVLFSPQLDYHRALLLVPFLWANIRQDCRRENIIIIIIELKQSSLH